MPQLSFPILDTHPLEPAILALDRLNRWVRSRSYRPTNSGPKRMIYWFKLRAIERLHLDGWAQHRRVFVTLKCRDCGGTGRWVDDWGNERNHCRDCGNSGRVRLEFLESRMLGVAWHSPVGLTPSLPGWSRDEYPPVDVTGEWSPNRVGKDLTPGEVAAALNEVEDAFPVRPRWAISDREADYRLFVGEAGPACSFCGAEAQDCDYCCSRCRIAWHGRACKACDLRHRQDSKINIFDVFPIPVDLLVDPAVAEWIRRHPS